MDLLLFSVREVSDEALLSALRRLAERHAELEADLLAHLSEVDLRELYLGEGHPSLFAYCTAALHFSEGAAYLRITAARAARSFPRILEMVRSGELHLSGVRMLAAHLTNENEAELLEGARHKSKRAIEQMLADREPKPAVPSSVRRLPAPIVRRTPPATPPPAPVVEATVPGASSPLGAGRFKVTFTADEAAQRKLEEARALLRHQIPDGDLSKVFDRALDALLREVRRTKFADRTPRQTPVEATGSRHIPAAIKRAVAERDQGRCTFVDSDGRRCDSRDFLEFHHRVPFARAKRHRVEEITLRCRAHNRHAATLDFGAEWMARWRSS